MKEGGFHQGSLPVDRGTIPQQHPMQETSLSHPSAQPFDQLLASALSVPVTLAEAVENLLEFWQVLYHWLWWRLPLMVPVIATTTVIVRCRLSSAPMKRSRRPSCFGFAQLRCPEPKSFAAVSSMSMMPRRVHFVLSSHVVHQAQSELVHVHAHQVGVRRFLGPSWCDATLEACAAEQRRVPTI